MDDLRKGQIAYLLIKEEANGVGEDYQQKKQEISSKAEAAGIPAEEARDFARSVYDDLFSDWLTEGEKEMDPEYR